MWGAAKGKKIEVNRDWNVDDRLVKRLKVQLKCEDWQLAQVARKSFHTCQENPELVYTKASTSESKEVLEVNATMNKAAHLLDPSLVGSRKLRLGNSGGANDPKAEPNHSQAHPVS